MAVRDSDGSEHVETFVDADGALRLQAAKLVLGTANAVPSRNAPGSGVQGGLTINIIESVPQPGAAAHERVIVGSADLSQARIHPLSPPPADAGSPPAERVKIALD